MSKPAGPWTNENALGRPAPQEPISVFWNDGGGFSESRCVSRQLAADGRFRVLRFDLPAGALGPLRLDPGGRRLYGEIRSAVLNVVRSLAGDGDGPRLDSPAARWSADNVFSGFSPARDLIWLPGGASYRFLVRGDDPQILIDAPLLIDQEDRDHSLEVIMRLVEDFRDDAEREIVTLIDAATAAQSKVARDSLLLRRAAARQAVTLEKKFAALLESTAREITDRFQEQLDEREKRLSEISGQFAEAKKELDRIHRTFAWRLFGAYGLVKHKLLIPTMRSVFRAFRSDLPGPSTKPEYYDGRTHGGITEAHAIGEHGPIDEPALKKEAARVEQEPPEQPPGDSPEASIGKLHVPDARPVNELCVRPDILTWESLGGDPQFLLDPPFPRGWVELLIHVESPDRAGDHAHLYIDRGSGFTQDDSVDLGEINTEQSRFVFLAGDVVRLRLDPITSPGLFKLRMLEFFEVSESDVQEARSFRPRLQTHPYQHFQIPSQIDLYDAWLEVNRWSERRERLLRARLLAAEDPPTISVVMPVYNPPPEFLNLAIKSVANQVYDGWELCIADDATTDEAVKSLLNQWAACEPRIKLLFKEKNSGISDASNCAAGLATGEYLLLMDNDDALSPDALGEIALYITEHRDADVVYADEDKIDGRGRRYDPGLKPDWSPELFLSYNYINHPFIIRRSLFERVNGFDSRLNYAQDWDLGLRATEAARHIGHIPLVLYHWRAIPSSVAFSGESKPQGMIAAREAVQTALDRRRVDALVYQPDWAIAIACAYYAHRFPDSGPSVSILVPTRNNVAVLRTCISSLSRTAYRDFEVVIIDNGSDDPSTLEYLAASAHRVLRIESTGGAFSFADINNRAVAQVSGDYILFLNDDTEVISPEWLSQMVGYLGIPGVGAVGARLLYPDGRVQHAGVVHSSYVPGPWHAFRFSESSSPGFMGWSLVARNCSAVTAACMLTPRDLFAGMGGFDSKSLPVAYNDVDYCYRLLRAGYRIAYCATAELIHHESLSRGNDGDPAELAEIFARYDNFTDKYYSPYLRETGPIELAPKTLALNHRAAIPALVCSHNLNLEGAPLVQMEITLGLKARGVIDPIVFSPEDGPLRAEYESNGVPVMVRPHPLRSVAQSIEGYNIGMEVFTNWVRTLNVELVYANTLRTFYAIDAANRAGLPSIWNPRESEDWQTYFDDFGPEIAAVALNCFAYPYQVVFVSDASRERFDDLCSRHNFITIHDGLDQDKFHAGLRAVPRAKARSKLGLETDEVAILTVGTICARKGQLDIVAALENIDNKTAAKLRWFVVGEKHDSGIRKEGDAYHLRSRQNDLDQSKATRLQIVPETPDVLTYYSAADLFVCTSRVESFPRVILEAMAAGLPIVTTPVFGIVEQVRSGRNALFYNPGDVAGLASAVTRLVNEPDLRKRMGAASSSVLASRISHQKMIEGYANVFREAWLSGGPRAS